MVSSYNFWSANQGNHQSLRKIYGLEITWTKPQNPSLFEASWASPIFCSNLSTRKSRLRFTIPDRHGYLAPQNLRFPQRTMVSVSGNGFTWFSVFLINMGLNWFLSMNNSPLRELCYEGDRPIFATNCNSAWQFVNFGHCNSSCQSMITGKSKRVVSHHLQVGGRCCGASVKNMFLDTCFLLFSVQHFAVAKSSSQPTCKIQEIRVNGKILALPQRIARLGYNMIQCHQEK